MTPHIEAKKEDIAKVVIMPGDPRRAKYIALHYLDDARLVSKVRNIYAYTGKYKGHLVTIMASGMGMPSMGIYSYELYHFYQVDKIIRVGTCGAYTKDLNLFDLILVTSAYSKSNYAKVMCQEASNTLASNLTLNRQIKATARKLHYKLRAGKIYSSDCFYNFTDNYQYLYNHAHCLGVEMESFALFCNAKYLHKKAACLLTVSDNLETKAKTTPKEREQAMMKMIVLALESLI